MKYIGRLGVAMLLVVSACSDGTSPSKQVVKNRSKSQMLAAAAVGGIEQAGNDFYQVFVQSAAAPGIGQYTVTTGPQHPVTRSTGAAQNVLFGNGAPGTTYNSIFSYTTHTAYVAISDATPGPGL